MQLVRPNPHYKDSFLKAAEEIMAEGNGGFLHDGLQRHAFEDYCRLLIEHETGKGLPAGYAPGSHFWLVTDDEFLGRVSVRHWLTDELLTMGGHIGYIITPAHRRKGYGTLILKLGLVEAAKIGINKVLVTCDRDNIGSAKIIEANGGVFENELFWEKTGVWKRRYWITN